MPDNMIFFNVLSDQQRHDAVAEMNMRWEISGIAKNELAMQCLYIAAAPLKGHPQGCMDVVSAITDPAKVADVWVVMNSFSGEADMQAYIAEAAQAGGES